MKKSTIDWEICIQMKTIKNPFFSSVSCNFFLYFLGKKMDVLQQLSHYPLAAL